MNNTITENQIAINCTLITVPGWWAYPIDSEGELVADPLHLNEVWLGAMEECWFEEELVDAVGIQFDWEPEEIVVELQDLVVTTNQHIHCNVTLYKTGEVISEKAE